MPPTTSELYSFEITDLIEKKDIKTAGISEKCRKKRLDDWKKSKRAELEQIDKEIKDSEEYIEGLKISTSNQNWYPPKVYKKVAKKHTSNSPFICFLKKVAKKHNRPFRYFLKKENNSKTINIIHDGFHIHENWESKLTVEELIQEERKHVEGFKLWRSKILNELNCPSNNVEKKQRKGMSTATLKILF